LAVAVPHEKAHDLRAEGTRPSRARATTSCLRAKTTRALRLDLEVGDGQARAEVILAADLRFATLFLRGS
jgi:hypothetical protein